MEESILLDVRSACVEDPEDGSYDRELIGHINRVLGILNQLGVSTGNARVTDQTTGWKDLFPDDENLYIIVDYVKLKVSYVFNPPSSAHKATAMKADLDELEYRLINYC